jgi:hypothetical protein
MMVLLFMIFHTALDKATSLIQKQTDSISQAFVESVYQYSVLEWNADSVSMI